MFELLSIAMLTVLAAGVGTLSGFGTSTILVPALSLFLPLPQTLLVVGIVHAFGNLWKVLLFRSGIRWKILLGFGIPGIATSLWGASLAASTSQPVLARTLGVFLPAYAFFLLWKPKLKVPQTPVAAVAGGALGGFSAGIFGIGGAIRSLFLTLYDLPKTVYIFTGGAVGLLIDTTRLATYWQSGVKLEQHLLIGLALFIPASFLGAKLAQRLAAKIPQEKFRFVVAGFLLLAGIKLLLIPP